MNADFQNFDQSGPKQTRQSVGARTRPAQRAMSRAIGRSCSPPCMVVQRPRAHDRVYSTDACGARPAGGCGDGGGPKSQGVRVECWTGASRRIRCASDLDLCVCRSTEPWPTQKGRRTLIPTTRRRRCGPKSRRTGGRGNRSAHDTRISAMWSPCQPSKLRSLACMCVRCAGQAFGCSLSVFLLQHRGGIRR